jgi:hypothetical protein
MRRRLRCTANLERRRPRASNGRLHFPGFGPSQQETSRDTLPEVHGSVRFLYRLVVGQKTMNRRRRSGLQHADQNCRRQQQPRSQFCAASHHAYIDDGRGEWLGKIFWPRINADKRRCLHLVAAQVFVVQALQPAAEFFVVDLVGGGVGHLGILEHRFIDIDGAIQP